MDIKIFITNLGKYNEGELVGEWVDLPVDEDELEEVLERIGISDEPDENGNYYEEYFITDYEAPFTIDQYEDIYELNEFADEIEYEDIDEDTFEAVSDEIGDARRALDILINGDYSIYYCNSPKELAMEFYPSAADIPSPEYYFDYEEFGSTLDMEGFFDGEVEDLRYSGDYKEAEELEEEFENMSDYDKGEYGIEMYGGIESMDSDTLELYIDWDSLAEDIMMERHIIECPDGYIELY